MPRFLLIGLCEPPDADAQSAFDEWFVGQHIEDTARKHGGVPLAVKGSGWYELVAAHDGPGSGGQVLPSSSG